MLCADKRIEANIQDLCALLESIVKRLQDSGYDAKLDDQSLQVITEALDDARRSSDPVVGDSIASLEQYAGFLDSLQEFCRRHDIEFDFTVVFSHRFESGFENLGIEELKVWFGNEGDRPVAFKAVTKLLHADGFEGSEKQIKPFYLLHHHASDPGFKKRELIEFHIGA